MNITVRKNALSALLFVLLAALIVWVAIPLGVQEPKKVKFLALSPSYYPRLVIYCLLGFGVLLGLKTLLGRGRSLSDAARADQTPNRKLPILLLVSMILLAYYWFLPDLGFVLSSIFSLAALLWIAGERSPLWIVLISVCIPSALYVFFTQVANIPIPSGVLEPLLVGS